MHFGESASGICPGARYRVTLKKDSRLIAPNQKASGKEPKSLGGFPFKPLGWHSFMAITRRLRSCRKFTGWLDRLETKI